MFYEGGEIPPCVNYIGISWVRTITHTQEPMTLAMDSWHTSKMDAEIVFRPSQELWRTIPECLFKKSFLRDTKGRKR